MVMPRGPYRPNLSHQEGPIGPLRDRFVHTVHATDDYEDSNGFLCQLGTAGDVEYRTMLGTADITESGKAAGDVISVGTIPVVLIAVRSLAGSTTVTSLVIGVI